jgi:hypothetical protein
MKEGERRHREPQCMLLREEIMDQVGQDISVVVESRGRSILRPRLERVHLDLDDIIPAGLQPVEFSCGFTGDGGMGEGNSYYVAWRSERTASVVVIPQRQAQGTIDAFHVHRDKTSLMDFLTTYSGYQIEDVRVLVDEIDR